MSYWVLSILSKGLTQFSPKAIESTAQFLTWLCFDILRIRRNLILQNLKTAFPKKSHAWHITTGKDSVYHACLTLLEVLATPAGQLHNNVELKNPEPLAQALSQGGGAYILCGHLGNWEAMGARITASFADAHIVAKRIGVQGIERFLHERRLKNGFYPIHKKKKGDGFQKITAALQNNHVIGFAVDQARPNSPKMPFFNALAPTNTSLSYIWERSPAPLIPAFIKRHRLGHHIIEFGGPIVPPTKPLSSDDHKKLTQNIQKNMEDMIRKAPEQYFWFHDRWRHRVSSRSPRHAPPPSTGHETKSVLPQC